jgi:predicted lactoylglutathione lyase
MNPKMIWANFAVSDLARTTKFYTELGFKSNNTQASKELTSFKFGENDFVIHFFLKEILETNIKGKMTDSQLGNEIIFSLSAHSKAQVDEWATAVENAGGKLITQPELFGNDYYGFIFADPDGHRFNVFYMKGF